MTFRIKNGTRHVVFFRFLYRMKRGTVQGDIPYKKRGAARCFLSFFIQDEARHDGPKMGEETGWGFFGFRVCVIFLCITPLGIGCARELFTKFGAPCPGFILTWVFLGGEGIGARKKVSC